MIGCALAELLLARGEDIVLLDARQPACVPAGTRFVTADVTDAAAIDRIVADHGVRDIVHTAAMLSTAMRGPSVDMPSTANLLQACRQHGLRRFSLAGSTTVLYGA